MSWSYYPPYVPVAQRRRKAQAAAKRMSKTGRALAPVTLATRKIASTFWGKAWCDNLEAYSDFSNRLPRGRSYVRNGSIIDLQISAGKVEALVAGSALYKIAIKFSTLAPQRWKAFKTQSAGKVTNLLDLLQGRLSHDILADITAPDAGLFPTPKELSLACSCPDWAGMCKHVAAVLYGVGARLDQQPELFFTLRGVDHAELIVAASAITHIPGLDQRIDDTELSEIFGVEIEAASPPPAGQVKLARKAPSPKRAKPATKGKPVTKVIRKPAPGR